jgi:predicted MFS family arabinose efflux permease
MAESAWRRYRRAYEGLPREAWILAGINLINAAGTMVVFFLTLYLTRELGFPAARAGRAVGAFGLGMLFGTILGGKLADRLGTRAVQKGSLVVSGVLLIVLGLARGPAALFALVFLSGVSSAALFPANVAAMAEICGPLDRGRGFVLNRLASNLGSTVAPVAGGLLARLDYRLLFWGDGLTCLVAAFAFFLFLPGDGKRPGRVESKDAAPAAVRWKSDGVLRRLLLGSFGSTLIFGQLYGAFPIFLRTTYGLPESAIGLAIAVNPLLIVLAQMAVTKRVERLPLARVAAAGTAFLAAGYALLPLGSGLAAAVLATLVWTAGEMLYMPTQLNMISFRAPEGAQGTYQGLNSLAFGLGIVAGPALGTQILQSVGPTALWLGVGVIGLIVAAFYWRLDKRMAPPSVAGDGTRNVGTG